MPNIKTLVLYAQQAVTKLQEVVRAADNRVFGISKLGSFLSDVKERLWDIETRRQYANDPKVERSILKLLLVLKNIVRVSRKSVPRRGSHG
jgi:hypothetical protein